MKTLTTIIPAVFNQIKPGATFMSIMQYENNYSELSNFGLVFHVNYINAVRRSLNILLAYQPGTSLERQGRQELLDSYRDTLRGYNPRATSAHAYSPIVDGHQELIKGVKYHDRGTAVHLWGFRVNKVILRPGLYPAYNSYDLTHVKRKLRNMTPLRNFRQFKLVEGRFQKIGVANLSLTDKDLLRELE